MMYPSAYQLSTQGCYRRQSTSTEGHTCSSMGLNANGTRAAHQSGFNGKFTTSPSHVSAGMQPSAVHGSSIRSNMQETNPNFQDQNSRQLMNLMQHADTIDQCPYCKNIFSNSLELAKHFSGRCPQALKILSLTNADFCKVFQRRSRRHAKRFRMQGQTADVPNRPAGTQQTSHPSRNCCEAPCPCSCARSNSITSLCPHTALSKSTPPPSLTVGTEHASTTHMSPVDRAIREALSTSTSRPRGDWSADPSPLAKFQRHHHRPRRPVSAQSALVTGRAFKHPAINNPQILKQAAQTSQSLPATNLPHPARIPTTREEKAADCSAASKY